jgi:hypothetical protein
VIGRAGLAAAVLALLTAADSDEPLKGYAPAGPALRCLGDSHLSPVILDRQHVGLRGGARRWWVSRIEACPSLDPLSTLVIERYGALCANDRFRVRTPPLSLPSAYCRFAPFVPYARVKPR